MTNYTEEQLLKAQKEAPEDIQELLNDPDFGPVVFMFATEQHVADDVALDIEDIVTHTLLGLEPLSDLQQEIQKLGVLPKAAEKIVEELDRNIFTNVKTSLNGMQKKQIPPKPVTITTAQPLPAMPTTPPLSVAVEDKRPLSELIIPKKPAVVTEPPQNLPVAPTTPPTAQKPTTPRHIFEKALQEKQSIKTTPPTPQANAPTPATLPPAPEKKHPTSKPPYPKDFNKPPKHIDPYREQV